MMFGKSPIPAWSRKRIKEMYIQCICNVKQTREKCRSNKMLGRNSIDDLRRYSYAIGRVAALEELMDRLFIEYDDEGQVPELRI